MNHGFLVYLATQSARPYDIQKWADDYRGRWDETRPKILAIFPLKAGEYDLPFHELERRYPWAPAAPPGESPDPTPPNNPPPSPEPAAAALAVPQEEVA